MDDRARALALIPVSHETLTRLDAYVDLLGKWQKRTNLIAPSTVPHVWMRHVADSAQLLKLAPTARQWIDIGSGAGFPGIVIACCLAETSHAKVHLVERNGKKAAFLREALRVTQAPGEVHLGDIADCVGGLPPAIDVVTARAVAPLSDLIDMARPWLVQGARGLFPKGLDVDRELSSTSTYGILNLVLHDSVTGDGCIVELAPMISSEISF